MPGDRSTLVIAGAGDVGGRLARLRAARGDEVLALRRRPTESDSAVRAVCADLVSGVGLRLLPRRADALVFCAAPDRRDEAAYRALFVDGLRRMLDHVQAPRVLLVSSTAVYGEDAGEWVDEDTPEQPPAFNGRVLRAAEGELARERGAVVLRLTGLYGPGRDALLRRARAGTPGRPHWTNRVHVDDAAAALSHLLDLPQPDPLYLGSDALPALESDVFAWVRAHEGLAPVVAAQLPESGRRVSSARLRASGWTPRYPDYRSGYAGLLAPPGQ
ncbi:NAD-dependent epimerase/dehydratase family protein [Lysobacter koreensis]|uniref:NAD-dependent epimerase/dehydratase family protein n=1 Tax=Lysobacter koreensis TaxID=266122 RepID=A0ABW2YQ17_9GAMM